MKLEGFSRYEIDVENGKVYSEIRNREIGSISPDGYYLVTLQGDDGKSYNFKRSRLIYMTAFGKIPDYMQVNHIDENTKNDSVSNLNLMTSKENCNFGTRNKRLSKKLKGRKNTWAKDKLGKKIGAYQDGELVMCFNTMAEAHSCGFHSGHISSCCRGLKPQYKNYIWKYLENNDKESS